MYYETLRELFPNLIIDFTEEERKDVDTSAMLHSDVRFAHLHKFTYVHICLLITCCVACWCS
jgi:hypothetical protein